MSKSLEYQAKFKADTSELKAAQAEVAMTGKSMSSLAQAGGGIIVAFSGLRDILRGNADGLINLAYGAGMAWKALTNLTPLMRIISIGLAVLKGAQMLWNHEQEKSARKAEESKRAIDALGLSISEMDKHLAKTKDAADNFERIEKAASAAADAIRKMSEAQIAFNQASGQANIAKLDLEEAQALSGAGTDAEKRVIRREFATKRADEEKRIADQDYTLKVKAKAQERFEIESGRDTDSKKREQLTGAADDAKKLINDKVSNVVSTIVSGEDFSNVPMDQRWKARMNREKEIKAEFEADPTKASRKYAGGMGADNAGEMGKLLSNLSQRQQAISEYDTGSGSREADRQAKLDQNRIEMQSLGKERDARINNAEASRVAQISSINTEEAQAAATSKDQAGRAAAASAMQSSKDRDASAEARRNARHAVAEYNYGQLSDEDKQKNMGRAIKSTRDQIAQADDDVTRGSLVEKLVKQKKEYDSVTGRLGSAKSSPDDAVSQHRGEIENIKNFRSTQSADISQVFQRMYDIKSGKTPDEQVAANTKSMNENLSAIATILQEAAK